jgi:hypothetical protein
MKPDYIKLAELGRGEKPFKGYYIPLKEGYFRIMASRLDTEGMVVSINYYGKAGAKKGSAELTRVTEKRQKVEDFEADLARFRKMLEASGITIEMEDLRSEN